MPVARIYAALVEEAEPICADLLARGYHVEVVFPDAVLPNPADLELRVERCSAEQAIARVEASGSPDRCVFVTPSKGPRRELLLVEMTVLATGTDGRHPMAMPGMALVPTHLAAVPLVVAETVKEDGLAEILPFPVAALEPSALAAGTPYEIAVPSSAVVNGTGVSGAVVNRAGQIPSKVPEKEQNLNKNLIAELNAFLAHAPAMERPEGLPLRIFENVRHSAGVERARRNWEGLTLAGVAASLVLLMGLGWYASPSRSTQMTAEAARPAMPVARPVPPPQGLSVPVVDARNVKPAALAEPIANTPVWHASKRRVSAARLQRREPRIREDMVAQDHVVQVGSRAASRTSPEKISPNGISSNKISPNRIAKAAQPTTTSELIQPAAIRSAPIKIITDLK